MATLTAQLLVGSPHPNHDGINPTHYLFLSENDPPAWILVNDNIFTDGRRSVDKITWIPTLENMLEDAFVMIAVHVCKNRELIELAKGFNSKVEMNRVEVYSAFEENQRNELYSKCQSISDLPKVIISIFRGSTIDKQLPILERYRLNVEVCRVGYSRLYSSWSNETRIEGSLQKT